MTKQVELSIGADPEFFLFDRKDKRFVGAHGFIPGDKDKPFPVNKGAVQVDGMAVEFNIDPANTPEEFATNVESVLTCLRDMIDDRYAFAFRPWIKFDKKYFESDKVPEKQKELGCNPDFNAWTSKQNVIPADIDTQRTASGHIHLGWGKGMDVQDPYHVLDCETMVRALDYTFRGQEAFWNKDVDYNQGDLSFGAALRNLRRKYYGNFGAYRPKPYGVEYRALDNSWLKYPDLWPYIFKQAKEAYAKILNAPDKFPGGSKVGGNNPYNRYEIGHKEQLWLTYLKEKQW